MAEKNAYADTIGEYLWQTQGIWLQGIRGARDSHRQSGEITKKDLDKARQAARDIDKPENKIKAIVSVMMLREGWDVRNVSVVLGLRPFTAKAEILPEQVIGRGLRLMTAIGPDRTQTLEVLGTRNLLNVLREQLEAEGVGVATTKNEPPRPVTIDPVEDRLAYDIAIPITKPHLIHNDRKLSTLDLCTSRRSTSSTNWKRHFASTCGWSLPPLRPRSIRTTWRLEPCPWRRSCLRSITNKVIQRAKLPTSLPNCIPSCARTWQRAALARWWTWTSEAIRSHLPTPGAARKHCQISGTEDRRADSRKADHRV